MWNVPVGRRALGGMLVSACAAAAGHAQFIEPPIARDVNHDPTIVEVVLEASTTTKEYFPGTATEVAAYNGSIPGPTLVANVGDTLVVHFTNNLRTGTTVHWHGLEVPARMDGSHIAQKPIPGDGGTFDYRFKLLTPGMFWYHPHIRTNLAIESGLYGAILVRDPVGEAELGLPTVERVVIFDDILIDEETKQIASHFPSDPLQKVDALLNGRMGNHVLINGRIAPVDFAPVNGVPERWRILNAANTRFMRMSFEDTSSGSLQIVFRIGGDGGLLESPILKPRVTVSHPELSPSGADHVSSQDPEEGIFLTPGERADVVWTPSAEPGEGVFIRNHEWNRGAHEVMYDPGGSGNIVLGDDLVDGTGRPMPLMRGVVQGSPGAPYVPPDPLRDIAEIDPDDVVGTLKLVMGHSLPPYPPDGSGVALFMHMGTPMSKVTSLVAHDVVIGGTYIWEVTNMSHMDHPFHTHGWSFQPFELEYTHVSDPLLNYTIPLTQLENKDTFRIPGRIDPAPMSSSVIFRAYATFSDAGREGRVRAEGLHPGDDVSGGWLAHCHVLEHASAGMMTFFETRYPQHETELLGFGLSGADGIPELRIAGDLRAGATTTLTLTRGAPGALSMLFAGVSPLATPFLAGTLLPSADSVLVLANDDRGEIHEVARWPVGVPPGSEAYWQVWSVDPSGPVGFSASNAVKTIAQ